MHTVRLEQFEGPLDLLLNLIEERKMSISEISLAEVTDQYLRLLKSDPASVSLAQLADFLVVAARLILIKSRALLPGFALTEEEENEIRDLEIRLEEYKRYREVSRGIARMLAARRIAFGREYLSGFKQFLPPAHLRAATLAETLEEIIEEFSRLRSEAESAPLETDTIRAIVSFEKKLEEIRMRVLKEVSNFKDLVGTGERVEVIVTFLAILELSKQKIIITEQYSVGSDITIRPQEPSL